MASQRLRYIILGPRAVDLVACLEVELGAAAALLGVRIAAAAIFEADLVEYCLLLEGRPARIAETAREGFKKLFSTPAKVAQLAPRPPRHCAESHWIRLLVLLQRPSKQSAHVGGVSS